MNAIDQEQLRLAWPLYFPGEQAPEGRSQDATLDLVRQFRFYFLSDACRTLLPTLSFSSEVLASGSFAVHLDYELLRREGPYLNFQNDLIDAPQRMLLAIGMALYLAYQHKMGEDWFPSFPRVHARIFNLPTVTPLRNLRTVLVGKFVSLRGTVVRCSAVKPVLLSCDFLCPKCSARQTVHSTDGRITPPTKCTTKGCRAKAMTPDRPAAVTEDWQRIRLQEVMDEERDAGRMPRSVDCELRGDLVDCCAAGDEITLTGIVRAMPSSGGGGGGMQSNMQTVYTLYIDVNSVSNTRSAAADGSLDAAQFSETDMAAIRAIQNEPQLFRLLVHSLCPSIFGHEIVKAGLVLVLFGAAQPKSGSIHSSSTTVMHVRGDPHMLVVGDPGMGKSNLLKAVSQIAPRCVYVCGNTATTTGLTVTVVKDSGSGDYSLEAGALVLADQGVCCIDEFDKMSCEHAALLEAMEQQSISIAKAGMVCNLPARTSVIAAANPVGGHYNKAKTVAENIKLPSPLLSRFDIIFILLDRPNVVHDRMLSEHVMRIHSTRRPLRQTQALDVPVTQEKHHKDVVYGKSAVGASSSSSASSLNVDSETLLTRLCLKAGERLDVIPPVLLRKYITYARRFVHPRLSPEAAEMLKLFYLSLRAKDTGDAAPITTRQLESLVRLAKARARAELREIVTAEDAQDVISIMKESFYDTVVDEFGNIDFDRPSRGGSSKAKDVTKYVAILTREAQKKGSSTFHVSELKDIAMRAQIKCASFDDFCNYLNMNNYLLKRGNGMYKLQTSGV